MELLQAQLAPETLLAEVQQVRGEVVGGAIAGEAEPTSERAGVLAISCAASVWAQELDLMAPDDRRSASTRTCTVEPSRACVASPCHPHNRLTNADGASCG